MKKLFVILLLISASFNTFSQPAVKHINVHDLATRLDESLLLIDVRTDLEFDQGYIPGAININFLSKNFEREVENYDRQRPIYLYCRSGHRSIQAAEKLISMGFQDVYSLNGGMIRWQQAKKPVNY